MSVHTLHSRAVASAVLERAVDGGGEEAARPIGGGALVRVWVGREGGRQEGLGGPGATREIEF